MKKISKTFSILTALSFLTSFSAEARNYCNFWGQLFEQDRITTLEDGTIISFQKTNQEEVARDTLSNGGYYNIYLQDLDEGTPLSVSILSGEFRCHKTYSDSTDCNEPVLKYTERTPQISSIDLYVCDETNVGVPTSNFERKSWGEVKSMFK